MTVLHPGYIYADNSLLDIFHRIRQSNIAYSFFKLFFYYKLMNWFLTACQPI